jgi:hypothetical protein
MYILVTNFAFWLVEDHVGSSTEIGIVASHAYDTESENEVKCLPRQDC